MVGGIVPEGADFCRIISLPVGISFPDKILYFVNSPFFFFFLCGAQQAGYQHYYFHVSFAWFKDCRFHIFLQSYKKDCKKTTDLIGLTQFDLMSVILLCRKTVEKKEPSGRRLSLKNLGFSEVPGGFEPPCTVLQTGD